MKISRMFLASLALSTLGVLLSPVGLDAADLKENAKPAKVSKLPASIDPAKGYLFHLRFDPANERHLTAVLLLGGFIAKDKRNLHPYHGAVDAVLAGRGRSLDAVAAALKARLKDGAFKEDLASLAEVFGGREGSRLSDILGERYGVALNTNDRGKVFDTGIGGVDRPAGPGGGGPLGSLFGNRGNSGMRDMGFGNAMSGECEVFGGSNSYKHSNGGKTSGQVESEYWVSEGGRSSHYRGSSSFDGNGNVHTVIVVEQTDANGKTQRSEKTVDITKNSDGTTSKTTETKVTNSDGESKSEKTTEAGGGRDDEGAGFQLTASQQSALMALAGNFRGPFAKGNGLAGGTGNNPNGNADEDRGSSGPARQGIDKKETVGGNYGPDGQPLQSGGKVNKAKINKGNLDPVKQQ